jgi:flagellum-specific peptidoglycan hydrolase FlgJ
MEKHGVPASITMAQGILESGSGTSDLATEANNHFGIKCHKDWTGKKFYKDDDQKDECFRVYEHPEASFEDHSLFLKRDRYASLFELKPTDYKGWAQGLKQCGYATNPKYPQLLIELIERHNLHELDQGSEAVSQMDDLKKKLAELY